MDRKTARGGPLSLVLMAFLLALPWAPWNSLKGSTFEGDEGTGLIRPLKGLIRPSRA